MSHSRQGVREGRSLAQAIFDELRRALLAGEWKAGETLPGERELSRQLGANRATLREALLRLQDAGLVSIRQGQGATVTDFRRTGTPSLLLPYLEATTELEEVQAVVEDLLEPRLQLLEQVSARAAQKAEPRDIEQLQSLSVQLVEMYNQGEEAKLVAGYWLWLQSLAVASHSTGLTWLINAVISPLRQVLERYPAWWSFDDSFPEYLTQSVRAVASGDAAAAARLVRDYFEVVDKQLQFLLRAYVGAATSSLPGQQRGQLGDQSGKVPEQK